MPYSIRTDLLKRYGSDEIEGLEAEPGKGQPAVTIALADAAAEIDGYISQRYQLPLPTAKIFPQLVWISCDIARYRLWEGKISDEQDTVYVRYKRAVKVLEGIAEGDISLMDESGEIFGPNGKGSGGVIISERPKVFTNDILRMMDYGDF
jgi:phage gp36-like protein